MAGRVVLGLSGGVDSSTVAALLMHDGCEVHAVTLILAPTDGACSGADAIQSAYETASGLGIAHEVVDLREEFRRRVIEPFSEAYLRGMTPNPCIECNRLVKFPALMRHARKCGAAHIATGHYARVEDGRLMRGADNKKDQSYVLYRIGAETVEALVLPLGAYQKTQTRRMAEAYELPAARRAESQEICFADGLNYAATLADAGLKGPIVDRAGKVLGMHDGIAKYTIGQRKGLHFAHLDPMYVTSIDPVSNTITVGPRQDALWDGCEIGDAVWLRRQRVSEFRATVKVRSMMEPVWATVSPRADGGLRLKFDEPVWAPAPGQSAVLYDGETVIGGGTIMRSASVL